MLLGQQIAQVRHNMDAALARRAARGLPVSPVKLVAVTKNHGVDLMQEAVDQGITDVGENRVQEAIGKQQQLGRPVTWHLIGHLQTNKVRQAVPAFDLIHSVDSERLAVEISTVAGRCGKVQDVLIQVNIGAEESKFGIEPAACSSFARFLSNLEHIRLCGIMAIAPFFSDAEQARPLFHELYQMYTELKECRLPHTDIMWLSMGMTNDYIVAIEEGSNLVRIGTAIFGSRQ